MSRDERFSPSTPGVPAARTMRGGVEWVLTLPPRLRYLLAWDHTLCRAVVAVYLRAVLGWLRLQGDTIDVPDPLSVGRWHARQQGFDLHAGIVVPAGSRERLGRLCRYALRPPVGQDRLQLMPDGTAVLELRRRWTDGTTHLVFDPVELLERLAALTPRPRINLILYHGVLAPGAAWRRAVVPAREDAHGPQGCATCEGGTDGTPPPRLANRTWAELMQRSFPPPPRLRRASGFDVLACPRCAGRLTLVALIQEGAVIQRILRHLGLPAVVPEMRP